MEKCSVSKATLGRLPYYLQHIKLLRENGNEYISATTIAKSLSLGEVQVRKDLNSVSGAGRPKIGYAVEDLIKSIEDVLGCNDLTKAVIVGAGKLGRALLNFDGFSEYGIEISAAFDIAPSKRDETQKPILPISDFAAYCKENNIKIGVITVNESAAQGVCNLMVENNIEAIWSFTPQKLNVPDNVLVKQVNLALSLAHLNNQLVNKNTEV